MNSDGTMTDGMAVYSIDEVEGIRQELTALRELLAEIAALKWHPVYPDYLDFEPDGYGTYDKLPPDQYQRLQELTKRNKTNAV